MEDGQSVAYPPSIILAGISLRSFAHLTAI